MSDKPENLNVNPFIHDPLSLLIPTTPADRLRPELQEEMVRRVVKKMVEVTSRETEMEDEENQ